DLQTGRFFCRRRRRTRRRRVRAVRGLDDVSWLFGFVSLVKKTAEGAAGSGSYAARHSTCTKKSAPGNFAGGGDHEIEMVRSQRTLTQRARRRFQSSLAGMRAMQFHFLLMIVTTAQ